MAAVDPLWLLKTAYALKSDGDAVPFWWHSASGERLPRFTPSSTHLTLPAEGVRLIFPRDVLTNYRSRRGTGPYYSLDAVCYLLERRDDSYTSYLGEVRRQGLTVVSLTDRKDLLEYVLGETDAGVASGDSAAAVDTEAELPTPLSFFPESKEGLAASSSSRLVPSAVVEPLAREDDIEEVKPLPTVHAPHQVSVSLVAPVQSTAELFVTQKDFTPTVAMARTVLQAMSSRGTADGSSLASGSLLEQISSINRPAVSGAAVSTHSFGTASRPWIIIVPAGASSLITLHNARELFEEQKYVSVAEARAAAPKPALIRINRRNVHFEILDNPARLQPADWQRVVAAFALANSSWQFKGWKWEQPVELFQHILGFHLHYDDMAVDPTVAGWNVVRLPLSRNKKHVNLTAAVTFWSRLEQFLSQK